MVKIIRDIRDEFNGQLIYVNMGQRYRANRFIYEIDMAGVDYVDKFISKPNVKRKSITGLLK